MMRFEFRILVQGHGRDNWEHTLQAREIGKKGSFEIIGYERNISTAAFVDIAIVNRMQMIKLLRPECVKAVVQCRDAIEFLKRFRTGLRRLREARVARGETA